MGIIRNENGLALMIAVVALLIFAVIAALTVSLVSNDSEMALYQFRSSEATNIANGGMQYAMQFYNSAQGTGTVSSAGTAVTGAGTVFTTQLQVGNKINANAQTRTVVSITDAANLTVDTAFAPALAASTIFYYTPMYPNFSQPPYCTPPACATNRGAAQVGLGSGGFTVDPAGVVSAGITNATNPIPAVCFDKGVADVGCQNIFPATGRILIDSELISYTAVAANSFTVGTRGAGGTLAASHLVNAGIHHATDLNGTVDGVTDPVNVPVLSTVGFIVPGTIKIDQEYLYCTGTGGTISFTGCVRGVQGSQRINHTTLATVVQRTATVNATVPTGVAGNAQRVVKGEQSVYLDGWVVGRNAGGGPAAIARWNGMDWDNVTVPASAQARLQSVFMLDTDSDGDADDGFAVGRTGTVPPCTNALILQWNGTAWNCVASPSNSNLNSVFMISTTDGWSVGNPGGAASQRPRIIHCTGGPPCAWAAYDSTAISVNATLNGVYCNSSADCWSVGDPGGAANRRPFIVQCTGGPPCVWAAYDSTAMNINLRLRSVYCSSSTDCWSVGDPGGAANRRPFIVQCTGGPPCVWAAYDSTALNINQQLNSVYCSAASDCWAVGQSINFGGGVRRPEVLRWNIPCAGGAATGVWNDCTAATAPIVDADLESVYMVSPIDGWAVGTDNTTNNGIILHWDGASWVRYASPTTNRFNEVFITIPKSFLRIGDWQEVY